MRELNTIQKVEKLNRVFATDEAGNGGANHEYMIHGVISETPIAARCLVPSCEFRLLFDVRGKIQPAAEIYPFLISKAPS